MFSAKKVDTYSLGTKGIASGLLIDSTTLATSPTCTRRHRAEFAGDPWLALPPKFPHRFLKSSKIYLLLYIYIYLERRMNTLFCAKAVFGQNLSYGHFN